VSWPHSYRFTSIRLLGVSPSGPQFGLTLTNNPPASVEQQLAHTGLASFFERSFSVETVQRFKPAADAYRSVAEALGVPIDGLRLVAAHAWDVSVLCVPAHRSPRSSNGMKMHMSLADRGSSLNYLLRPERHCRARD
jgi:hypothetical protein